MSLFAALLSPEEDRVEIPIFSAATAPMAASFLSTLATLITLIAALKSERNAHWNRMAVWLILGDFVFFLSKIIASLPYTKSLLFCRAFGCLAEIGGNSAFFWAPCFAHAMYTLTKHRNIELVEKALPSYFIFAVGVPIPYGLAVLFADFISLGSKTGQCVHYTILGQFDGCYFIFALLPLFLACVPCIFFYTLAGIYLSKRVTQDKQKQILAIALFPMILLVCWLPILISVFLGYFNKTPSHELLLAFETLANTQGFFDSLVYGGTLKSIRACCDRFRKRKIESKVEELEYSQF